MWLGTRVQSGLSSGEGLIWAVRDEIERSVKGKTVVEPGVDDKRLLIFESEFASVLRVIEREGNTLSAIIRSCWDTGNLRTLTKNTPAVATGAHVSVIGHVTADELRRYLKHTEIANGFGNRILWCAVRRSKALPFGGGDLDQDKLQRLQERLLKTIEWGSEQGGGPRELTRGPDANELWAQVYADLSDGKPGLTGALISRAEAQVVRLAGLYAVLDQTLVVGRNHLEAALAIQQYVEDSVHFIFGDRLGDPVADEILSALRKRANGLTRTEIRDLFGRNRYQQDIDRALEILLRYGLAYRTTEATGGRSAERWRAVGTQAPATTKTTETTEGGTEERENRSSVVNVVSVVPPASEGNGTPLIEPPEVKTEGASFDPSEVRR
jgi:hypothetical protein